jgi:transketolase
VCILTYGVITAKAVEVAQALAEKGKSVSVASCHTLKPLDREGIIAALRHHKQVIVIEEHVPEGGLASRVKQIAWDIKATSDLHTFTLQDAFIHNYGSYDDLLAAHGIAVPKILATVG